MMPKSKAVGRSILSSIPPVSKPARKQMRHSVSPAMGLRTPARMPLMPAILPSSKSIADALRPINMPPTSDGIGVKLCMS